MQACVVPWRCVLSSDSMPLLTLFPPPEEFLLPAQLSRGSGVSINTSAFSMPGAMRVMCLSVAHLVSSLSSLLLPYRACLFMTRASGPRPCYTHTLAPVLYAWNMVRCSWMFAAEIGAREELFVNFGFPVWRIQLNIFISLQIYDKFPNHRYKRKIWHPLLKCTQNSNN